MSQSPTFPCPTCGKQHKWKAELAGKKGKCKCGEVIQVPFEQPDAPEEDLYAVSADPEPIPASAAPAPMAAAAPMQRMAAAPVASGEASDGRTLHWAPALKWIGLGVLIGAWSVWEFVSPTDPNEPGRRRGLGAIVRFVNMFVGPLGGAIILGLFALFLLVVGVLILLGKAKDDEYEHEQQQDKWPASRGSRR